MNYPTKILTAIILFTVISCKQQDEKPDYRQVKEIQQELVDVNKILVQKDHDIIVSYAKRRGWDMQTTDAGLWYEIYHHGQGDSVRTGDMVSMEYSLSLLDGTVCYSSDSLGIKTFRVGKGGVESGLEMGVLMLRVGDKARFIMPPHLAHGLVGDDACIPARSIIIYDIAIVQTANQ